MRRRLTRFAAAALAALAAGPVLAEGEAAGEFDYYVLALSWSPTWCALEGDARNSPQCRDGTGFGWILHGLWPQYEEGWPSYCPTSEANPSRAMTRAIADITGTDGLAWHAWNKHGRCSGLSAEGYFAAARAAYGAVARPDILRKISDPVRLPASVVEEAFLEVNPALAPERITVTCDEGRIDEVRICLSKDLEPRDCGPDVARDCRMKDARLDPIR